MGSPFGVPSDLTSDRGPQFYSSLWCTISAPLGMTLHQTTARYNSPPNPQGGIVKHMHHTLKSALQARFSSECWVDKLSWVLLGIQTAPKLDLDCSPSDLVLCHSPQLLGDLLQRDPPPCLSRIVHTSIHSPHDPCLLPRLDTCLHAFICDDSSCGPLQPPTKALSRLFHVHTRL